VRLLRRRTPPPVRLADRYFGRGAEEARRLGHHYLGSEHVLLSLTRERDGTANVTLERLGVSRRTIEEEIRRTPATPSPAGIDPQALATLGIDFDAVRERIEQTFGEGAIEGTRKGCMRVEPCLKEALAEAHAVARHEPVDDRHVLVGLAAVDRSAAAHLLARLGVSETDVRRALADGHDSPRTD
jgi:ATP-dependent Clp protease ATP-binding subunit ClpA